MPTVLPRLPRHSQFQGSRAFHLVHNLFSAAVNDHSTAQLASVKKKTYPGPDNLFLKLVEGKRNAAATMTLSQALQRLKPLSYLDNTGPGRYRIQTLPDPGQILPIQKSPRQSSYKPWTRAGRGKELHLTSTCTPQNLRHLLTCSYKYLLEGSRIEFHLHQKTQDKQNRTPDWALEHCLHLRPDSILAAMPAGTTMLAEPATTDMSFKKFPEKFEHQKFHVMWAMENGQSLAKANAATPKHIKRLGQWAESPYPSNDTWKISISEMMSNFETCHGEIRETLSRDETS